MFYDNRTEVVYKVIGYVIYSIIDNFLWLNYQGILQQNLSDLAHDNKLEKNKFNDLSELCTPEILINIISCHGFSILTTSKVILTCHSSLVPYY